MSCLVEKENKSNLVSSNGFNFLVKDTENYLKGKND